jgi:hypothetical protein
MCRSRYLLLLASTLLCGYVLGQSAPDAAQAPQDVRAFKNPFAQTFALWFEFDTSRPIGDYSRVQNLFSLTSIIPIPLGTKWDLITKSAISAVSQPDLMNPRGSAWKLNDLTASFYFSPDKKGTFQWGVGPTFLLPTATGQDVGNGKWGAGPAGAVFAEPGKWTLGLEISDLKSFAGDRTRPDVHYASLQYFVTYNVSKGWYVTTQPQTSADWTVSRKDRWLMPIGLGVGKAVTFGKRQVSGELDGYYNLVHPTTLPYPKWILTLQLTFAGRNVL